MKDVEDLNKAEEIEVLQKALEVKLENLNPEDGDIILAHIDGEKEQFAKVFSCLNAGFAAYRTHNGKAVFLIGMPSGANLTLENLPEEKLNMLGWYKGKQCTCGCKYISTANATSRFYCTLFDEYIKQKAFLRCEQCIRFFGGDK